MIWENADQGFSAKVWLDNTNERTGWVDQMAWAASLNSDLSYHLFSGYSFAPESWRLPSSPVLNPMLFFEPITTSYVSELGNLYRDELGNTTNSGLGNTGPFENLISGMYWNYNTDLRPYTTLDENGSGHTNFLTYASAFDLGRGTIGGALVASSLPLPYDITTSFYGIACNSGLVTYDEPNPVPEPGTLALLGLGLSGLVFYRKKNKCKHNICRELN